MSSNDRETSNILQSIGDPQPVDLSVQRRRILPLPGWSGSPGPGGRPLSPREDGCILVITFHSQYMRPSGRINQGCAYVSNWLRRGRQPGRKWTQRGGSQIPPLFPPSGAISAALSYYRFWPIFYGWAANGKKRG